MIIIVSDWKKKILKFLSVLALIIAFAAAIPALTGALHKQIPAMGGWFQEEHPSGNPMRVEQNEEGTGFEKVMDRMVIKLQNFYYEE